MESKNKLMNMKKIERYSRQVILKNWNQKRLEKSTILVAGVGSLGCFSAMNFTLMGVGRLILVDYDTVEVSNLNRQILFSEEDVGKFKSDIAKLKLEKLNPSVVVEAYNSDLRRLDKKIFEEADIILDGLDSFETRRWLNSISVALKKPLIHGALYGWWGDVQVVLPYQTACLECQPLIPRNRLQQYCSPAGRARRIKTDGKTTPTPIINTTCMVVSGIQCQEALKIIMGLKDSLLKEYLFYDGESGRFTYMEVSRNPECIVCGDKYNIEGEEFAINPLEEVKNATARLNMIFGLKDSKMIYKGRFLDPEFKFKEYNIIENDIVYLISGDLEKPVKLKFKFI
ncbi:MAG: ThiF family adenylyltransferase [Candidatus Odinarchaeota archaeon]